MYQKLGLDVFVISIKLGHLHCRLSCPKYGSWGGIPHPPWNGERYVYDRQANCFIYEKQQPKNYVAYSVKF